MAIDGEANVQGVPNDVSLFYSKRTLMQIIKVRDIVKSDLASRSAIKRKLATFVCAVMLGILHGRSRISLSLPCNQCFAMSPAYVKRYVKEFKLKKPARNVKDCIVQKALQVLPFPKAMAPSFVQEGPAEKCYEYMAKRGLSARLVITSPPYLDRQTYLKDAWLRLWFLGRDWREIRKSSLETGNSNTSLRGMLMGLSAIWKSLEKGGIAILVCGRAKSGGQGETNLKVSDICLSAVYQLRSLGCPFRVEALIVDRILMKRGAYFAVIHGKGRNKDGNKLRRYGEDEILVLRKVQ